MDQITHLRRTKKWDSFYKVFVDKEWISWCLLSENLVVWNIQMTWDYLFNPWSKEALLSLLGDLWSFKLFSASTRELGLHPTRTIAMVLRRFRYGNNARRKMHLGSPSQWMTITWKQSHLTKLRKKMSQPNFGFFILGGEMRQFGWVSNTVCLAENRVKASM